MNPPETSAEEKVEAADIPGHLIHLPDNALRDLDAKEEDTVSITLCKAFEGEAAPVSPFTIA